MLRKIIHIDEEQCNGCGACVSACHEGAIGLVEGKARLLRDDYCDGLGDCLPACPTGAITFTRREAAAYDEAAVREHQAEHHGAHTEHKHTTGDTLPCGCPGSSSRSIEREPEHDTCHGEHQPAPSRLSQWPVQIKLAPVNAPYFRGAHLLIAADCTAYACGDFHERFIRRRITLIGCPKLDEGDYTEKLTTLIRENDIQSVTVVRMEVPCCGLDKIVAQSLQASGKFLPWQIVTIATDGRIIEN